MQDRVQLPRPFILVFEHPADTLAVIALLRKQLCFRRKCSTDIGLQTVADQPRSTTTKAVNALEACATIGTADEAFMPVELRGKVLEPNLRQNSPATQNVGNITDAVSKN